MKSLKGTSFILGGTVFWGMSAVVAKLLFDNAAPSDGRPVDTLILVQSRVTFSFIVMFLVFALFHRSALRIRPADVHRFMLMGVVGIAGSNFTYYFAIQQINVSTAILLQYISPVLVLVFARLTKQERLTGTKILAASLSIIGCFLAVGGVSIASGRISALGLVAGVGAAVCWAFANVYSRHLLNRYSVWTVLVYSFFAAAIFWSVINPPWDAIHSGYSRGQWLEFAGFAMISVLIPHSLYFTGVRFVSASHAIITGTFEPIVAITGSFLVLGDLLSPAQIAGGVIVVVSIALLQLKQKDFREHYTERVELQ